MRRQNCQLWTQRARIDADLSAGQSVVVHPIVESSRDALFGYLPANKHQSRRRGTQTGDRPVDQRLTGNDIW